MPEGVVQQQLTCGSLDWWTSPVQSSWVIWAPCEVLDCIQGSFLRQVQISNRYLTKVQFRAKRDACNQTVETLLPPFPLFQVSQHGTENKTVWKGRHLYSRDSAQQEALGREVGVNLSSSSSSPWQRPLSSVLWHTVAITGALRIQAVIKPLIKDAGDLALFPPTTWGDKSSCTLILGAQASSLVPTPAGTGEPGDLPPSCQAHVAPQQHAGGVLGLRQCSRALAGEGWSSATDLLTGPYPVPVSQRATGLALRGTSLAKIIISDLSVELGMGLGGKLRHF